MTATPIRRQQRSRRGEKPNTRRAFSTPDDLWFAALERAHSEGITLASVLVQALEDYVKHGLRKRR